MTLFLALAQPDLARGRYPAPAWLILGAAVLVVAFAVGFLFLRFRRRAPKDDR